MTVQFPNLDPQEIPDSASSNWLKLGIEIDKIIKDSIFFWIGENTFASMDLEEFNNKIGNVQSFNTRRTL